MHPSIIVKEKIGGDRDAEAFLVIENQVICKIPAVYCPLYLLAAYYVFNMSYPKGFLSMFIFLEKLLLSKHPPSSKVPQIVSFLFTSMQHMD